MRLLVLGGTRFVGRAVAADALARGWAVTVFHRGITGSPPPGVAVRHGDRTAPGSLGELARQSWDVVLDTWEGAPRVVTDGAGALRGSAAHYVYVSSRSVYRTPLPAELTEDAPLVAADPDAGSGDYGADKAGAERAVLRAFGPDRALLARAGLVLGPHEDVGRLPWWLARLAAGGAVPAPGPAELGVQYVDVRDLAGWLLDAAQRRHSGVVNAIGPPDRTTMAELLAHGLRVTGGRARLRWVSPEAVAAAGVRPWTELPLWIPPGHPFRALHRTAADRARAAGLRCRPPADTVADTWSWQCAAGWSPGPGIGLSPAAERRLLS
jgi:2'-hydroxyisoflavone reductase